MSIDGVSFEESYPARVEREIDGLSISFIGYKELIKNKKASGRDKDIIDLKNLT
jgi:hypothetical protein